MTTPIGEGQLDIFVGGAGATLEGDAVPPAPGSEALRRRCAALPASVRIGTSSWSFPGWAGSVYGANATQARLARAGLKAYAAHPALNLVGLDRTWHAPIAVHDYARYAAQVPDDFRFLAKAHALCTTPGTPSGWVSGVSARGGDANPYFLEPEYAAEAIVRPFVEGLRGKAGPLLFQFSPMSQRELARAGIVGPRAFADRLQRFLSALPQGPLYAVELRNRDLFTPRYLRALDASSVRHCLSVNPRMTPLDVQLDAVESSIEPHGATVLRWNLNPDFDYETAKRRYRPFDRILDPQPQLRALIARNCRQTHQRGDEAYIIINNKAEGSAPASALELIEAIVRDA